MKQKNNNIKKDNHEQNELISIVPLEIDTHFKLYGKHMWEVSYDESCPLCEKKIDEFGYCACNACSG
jgi:hypothetical protein